MVTQIGVEPENETPDGVAPPPLPGTATPVPESPAVTTLPEDPPHDDPSEGNPS